VFSCQIMETYGWVQVRLHAFLPYELNVMWLVSFTLTPNYPPGKGLRYILDPTARPAQRQKYLTLPVIKSMSFGPQKSLYWSRWPGAGSKINKENLNPVQNSNPKVSEYEAQVLTTTLEHSLLERLSDPSKFIIIFIQIVVWVVTPCILVGGYRYFGGTCCHSLQDSSVWTKEWVRLYRQFKGRPPLRVPTPEPQLTSCTTAANIN
jgi:hypothetical protein